MNILEALCSAVLFIHILDATSTDCTTKIYVSSNGFSCYPCPPGFHVLKECQINATTNICIPCPPGTFQPTCSTNAASCAKCGSCPEPDRQKITRNCTRTQDTICACLENYYWDTDHHICLKDCQQGKKITQGDEGEGLLCVPCEADTFSNGKNSHRCIQCTSCLNYKKNCTKTSDAICHQLTTETATTDKVTSPTTTITTPCAHVERTALTAVSVVLGIIAAAIIVTAILLIVFIRRKWLEYSTNFPESFPCSQKYSKGQQEPTKQTNNSKENDTGDDEELKPFVTDDKTKATDPTPKNEQPTEEPVTGTKQDDVWSVNPKNGPSAGSSCSLPMPTYPETKSKSIIQESSVSPTAPRRLIPGALTDTPSSNIPAE